MNKLWVLEALIGPNNLATEDWVPMWAAFDNPVGPTKRYVLESLKRQRVRAAGYVSAGIYTRFRVRKYMPVPA